MTGPAGRAFDRLLVAALLLAGWQGASAAWGEYWASGPLPAAAAFWRLVASGSLPTNALYTLEATAWGFAIGLPPGILLPFLLRRHPRIRAVLDPFMVAAYGVPKLALAPLFIVWFGIGIGSKVALVASVTFFIVYFNAMAGVAAVDRRLIATVRVMGAGERRVLTDVVWPASVPFVFAGIRTATPYAVGGTVVTELISSNRGLGHLIQLSANRFQTNEVFAALFGVLILVIGCNLAVQAVERRLLRWRPPVFAASGAAG
ncbi:MAG: ABC transporter permease [Rhodospirillales bacterium]